MSVAVGGRAAAPSHLRAGGWMAGWLASMVVMAVAGREATRELGVFQILELRSLIGMLLIYPLVRAAGGLAQMKTGRPLQHIGRNIAHYSAQFGWFFALTLIPLAQVIAIEFTMPIWTALLAVFFLGERMNGWKIAAVVLGLVGVTLIVRPHTGHVEPGQLIALAAAVGFSISLTMVKSLTRTESTLAILFWMLVVQGTLGIVPALLTWQPVPGHLWPWIVGIALCGTFSHYCMARAMLYADATIVVPMDFLRVPLTALAGYLLYAERLDLPMVVGAALILAGNLLNLKAPRGPVEAA